MFTSILVRSRFIQISRKMDAPVNPQASGFGMSDKEAIFSSPVILMAKTNKTVTRPAPTLNSMTATSGAPNKYNNNEINALDPASHNAEISNRDARIA